MGTIIKRAAWFYILSYVIAGGKFYAICDIQVQMHKQNIIMLI